MSFYEPPLLPFLTGKSAAGLEFSGAEEEVRPAVCAGLRARSLEGQSEGKRKRERNTGEAKERKKERGR